MKQMTHFEKRYEVHGLLDVKAIAQKLDEAWRITCDYEDVLIVTRDDGHAYIQGKMKTQEALEMEARLEKVFQ